LRGGQAFDLLQAFAVDAIDVAGALAEPSDRERAVLDVVGHDLSGKAREHVAVRVIGEGRGYACGRDGRGRVVGLQRVGIGIGRGAGEG
jgi:hypothetical protein